MILFAKDQGLINLIANSEILLRTHSGYIKGTNFVFY